MTLTDYYLKKKHGERHSLLTKSMDDKFLYGIHFPCQIGILNTVKKLDF